MAPGATAFTLSTAELSFLHQSLSLHPAVRSDTRSAQDFRPVTAELDFLPSTYGSARAQLEDGSAAIVGIKASVAASRNAGLARWTSDQGEDESTRSAGSSGDTWFEVNVHIPDQRDDDTLPVYLGETILEALHSSSYLSSRCRINSRFHWKLYIDVREGTVVCDRARAMADVCKGPPSDSSLLIPTSATVTDDSPRPLVDTTARPGLAGRRGRPV